MALFPWRKGGREQVNYGYKGKGVTIHSLVDGEGNPLAVLVTVANESERGQVLPLLASIQIRFKREKWKVQDKSQQIWPQTADTILMN